MLLHLLDDQDQTDFLHIAHLVCLSDTPLLWDGKAETEQNGTSELKEVSSLVEKSNLKLKLTIGDHRKVSFQQQKSELTIGDLRKVSFQQQKSKQAIMESFLLECAKSDMEKQPPWMSESISLPMLMKIKQAATSMPRGSRFVMSELLNRLESLPLNKESSPEERLKAAMSLLQKMHRVERRDDNKVALPAVPKIMLFELLLLALADGAISFVEGALLKEFSILRGIEDYIFDDLHERAAEFNQVTLKAIAVIFE